MFKCDVCDKSYATRSNLRRHLLMAHAGVRGHRCPSCDQQFTHAWLLRRHTKKLHEAPTSRLQCAHCAITFKRKSSMQRHITNYHPSVKVPQLEQPPASPPPITVQPPAPASLQPSSPETAASPQSLAVRHQRFPARHLLPWRCMECGRSHWTRDDLQRHLEEHPRDPPQEVQLASHAQEPPLPEPADSPRAHSPANWECRTCGALYSTGDDLLAHLLQHEEVDPVTTPEHSTSPTG